MAYAGNAQRVAWARQNVAGTPADVTKAFVSSLVSGGITPQRDTARWDETSGSRSVQPEYVQSLSGRGTFEVYLRPDNAVPLLEAALGAGRTSSGSTNFQHALAINDAIDLPLLTLWMSEGGAVDTAPVLSQRYKDAIIDTVTFNMAANGVLSMSCGIKSKTYDRITSNYPAAPTLIDPYYFSNLAVSKGGNSMANVTAASISVAQNTQDIMGNGSLGFYLFPGATRVITGTMSLLWLDVSDFNNFHYGSPSGTSPVSTIFGEHLILTASKDINTSIAFDMVLCDYDNVEIVGDKNGVFMENLSFTAVPSGATKELVVTVKNQTAGTAYDPS